ncbi:hypothetical protein MVEN_02326200 [Mycena venus]|uniref:Uncharacterized protein n=1 Tax=Mycena venus TaxID=2733690 RepID=A0A8H7CDZ3_9AGAR|nr:hypothetical protein MVEN_02326200 [Mycena venus]
MSHPPPSPSKNVPESAGEPLQRSRGGATPAPPGSLTAPAQPATQTAVVPSALQPERITVPTTRRDHLLSPSRSAAVTASSAAARAAQRSGVRSIAWVQLPTPISGSRVSAPSASVSPAGGVPVLSGPSASLPAIATHLSTVAQPPSSILMFSFGTVIHAPHIPSPAAPTFSSSSSTESHGGNVIPPVVAAARSSDAARASSAPTRRGANLQQRPMAPPSSAASTATAPSGASSTMPPATSGAAPPHSTVSHLGSVAPYRPASPLLSATPSTTPIAPSPSTEMDASSSASSLRGGADFSQRRVVSASTPLFPMTPILPRSSSTAPNITAPMGAHFILSHGEDSIHVLLPAYKLGDPAYHPPRMTALGQQTRAFLSAFKDGIPSVKFGVYPFETIPQISCPGVFPIRALLMIAPFHKSTKDRRDLNKRISFIVVGADDFNDQFPPEVCRCVVHVHTDGTPAGPYTSYWLANLQHVSFTAAHKERWERSWPLDKGLMP